jgi:L-rhamnose-H+ transport protein
MLEKPAVFFSSAGKFTVLGIAVILAGVVLCGLAGRQKERQPGGQETPRGGVPPSTRRPFLKGLLVVALSGFCDPFLNFAFTFGDRIKQAAAAAGAGRGSEGDAIWALALLGSLMVNVTYCSILLSRNRNWCRYRQKGIAGHWFLASAMGVAWMFSITLYGRGASCMGPLGGSIGWAVFYCCIIIFSSLCGMLTGEWREGRGRPLRTMTAGLAVLLVAVGILAYANALQNL